ncbi:hypothetical protein CHS0354_004001 [Potamilus streckersoni]|uniref:OTU domain-containing protein n=1 Tax=Potamilus streckersoni TaxID=2493646 RepID=A0AAE0S0E3_9BIVA|nr:hypothetical protein CHS0354_004001 [Potamilus streckersoni]
MSLTEISTSPHFMPVTEKDEDDEGNGQIFINNLSETDDEEHDGDDKGDNNKKDKESQNIVTPFHINPDIHGAREVGAVKLKLNFTKAGSSKEISEHGRSLERNVKAPSPVHFNDKMGKGSDKEKATDVQSVSPLFGDKCSSKNKNSEISKIPEFIKIVGRKVESSNFSKVAAPISEIPSTLPKSFDSGEMNTEGAYGQGSGKISLKVIRKKTSRRSSQRQMLQKTLSSMKRRYGRINVVPSLISSSPISLLKLLAQKSGMDMAALMENADAMGLNLPFPCSECFHKRGKDAYGKSTDVLKSFYEMQDISMDNKCPDCGAERTTLMSYGKMIRNLREMIESRNLVIHDVYPDGNCLYAAVVDQLRTCGVFHWTCFSLREAAVQYLRSNPLEEDGTHKEMYLASETWEQYLDRNSEDGIWGDHIMMSAIVEVLQRKIVILGGVSGKARTVIVPKSMHAKQKSQSDSEPVQDIKEDSPKDINNKEPTSQAAEKMKEKEEGEKEEEEDKEAKKKRLREEAIGRKEKEDDELEDETCLYLGHLSESHYISLRKQGIMKAIQEKLMQDTQEKKLKLKEENPGLFQMDEEIDYRRVAEEKNNIDPVSKEAFLHLNFTIRQLLDDSFEHIALKISPIDDEMNAYEMLGSTFEKLNPRGLSSDRNVMDNFLTEELSIFFPNSCEKKKVERFNIIGEDMLIYCIPHDTRVVEKDCQDIASPSDLVEEPIKNMSGTLYLLPKKTKMWKEKLVFNEDGKRCLQHINLPPSLMSFHVVGSMEAIKVSVRHIIAFKCQFPLEASEWISRERRTNWPKSEVIQQIYSQGCHIIPLARWEGNPGVDVDATKWEYSFAVAEKNLVCCHISKHQHNCFLILRLLIEKQLQLSHIFLYQVLKNIFLFTCEAFEDKMWSKQPGVCILHMISRFISCLQEGEAPMYFMPSRNLLRDVPREITLVQAQQMESLRYHPTVNLYWLLDDYNLTSTDIGLTLDSMFEDIDRFLKHKNVNQSMIEMVVPSTIEAATDLIMSSKYDTAFSIVLELNEELAETSDQREENSSIAHFVKHYFSELSITYRWCFAFYIDLKTGTNLIQDICLEYSCKPMTVLFGPEIVDYIDNRPVPTCLTQNDLKFVKEIVAAIRNIQNYKAIAVGLRYYLETLEDTYIKGKSFTKSQSDRIILHNLVNLYIELFYAYYSCKSVSEFADLLERFEKAVCLLDEIDVCAVLLSISTIIGNEDVTNRAQLKFTEKLNSRDYNPIYLCGKYKTSYSVDESEVSEELYREILSLGRTVTKRKDSTLSSNRKRASESKSYDSYGTGLSDYSVSSLMDSLFGGSRRLSDAPGESDRRPPVALLLSFGSPYDYYDEEE